jgi:hypothetical protein
MSAFAQVTGLRLFWAIVEVCSKQCLDQRPQQDSNLRTRLRRPLLYPLSYGGWRGKPMQPGPVAD